MNSSYVLLDLLTGNVITDFDCESDAWDALRQAAQDDGPEALENLSVLLIEDGHPTLIAMENELVRQAVSDDVTLAAQSSEPAQKPTAS